MSLKSGFSSEKRPYLPINFNSLPTNKNFRTFFPCRLNKPLTPFHRFRINHSPNICLHLPWSPHLQLPHPPHQPFHNLIINPLLHNNSTPRHTSLSTRNKPCRQHPLHRHLNITILTYQDRRLTPQLGGNGDKSL